MQHVKIATDLSGIAVAYNDLYNMKMMSKPSYNKCSLIDLNNLPREFVGTIAFPNTNLSTVKYINPGAIQNILGKMPYQLIKIILDRYLVSS